MYLVLGGAAWEQRRLRQRMAFSRRPGSVGGTDLDLGRALDGLFKRARHVAVVGLPADAGHADGLPWLAEPGRDAPLAEEPTLECHSGAAIAEVQEIGMSKAAMVLGCGRDEHWPLAAGSDGEWKSSGSGGGRQLLLASWSAENRGRGAPLDKRSPSDRLREMRNQRSKGPAKGDSAAQRTPVSGICLPETDRRHSQPHVKENRFNRRACPSPTFSQHMELPDFMWGFNQKDRPMAVSLGRTSSPPDWVECHLPARDLEKFRRVAF